jgi:hypothetical protein
MSRDFVTKADAVDHQDLTSFDQLQFASTTVPVDPAASDLEHSDAKSLVDVGLTSTLLARVHQIDRHGRG